MNIAAFTDIRRPIGTPATVHQIKTFFVVNWLWLDIFLYRTWSHAERQREKAPLVYWYLDMLRHPEKRATWAYLNASEIMELYRDGRYGQMGMTANLVGFYGSADQPVEEPTYDPPHDAPCPFCGTPISPGDVRTISIMFTGGAARSYFYRVHRTCHDAASQEEQDAMDGMAFDAVEAVSPEGT